MDERILRQIQPVTEEEQAILDGRQTIDRELYMANPNNVINSRKLLASGKLITLRTHTRFIHFPEHTHDYIELVYMCQGQTTHIVNGNRITLKEGELLFLNQSARHEVCQAGMEDIAVNFIVLPDFFSTSLTVIGEEETPLRHFLVDCLCGQNSGPGYLLFRVADVKPVQNLVENLLFILLQGSANKRKSSQMTMALLFLELTARTEALETGDEDQAAILKVLSYVETRYVEGSLTELAEMLHYDLSWLSREIKRQTGKTYTQLVQEKRLAQAAFLLRNTNRNVDDIAGAVGYENMGYFHRIFREAYGISPRTYRVQIR